MGVKDPAPATAETEAASALTQATATAASQKPTRAEGSVASRVSRTKATAAQKTEHPTAPSTDISLVDQAEDVEDHLAVRRGKAVAGFIVAVICVGTTYVPMHPESSLWPVGAAAYLGLLTGGLGMMRNADRSTRKTHLLFHSSILMIIVSALPLLFYSGVYSSMPVVLLALMAFNSVSAPPGFLIAGYVSVAITLSVLHLLVTFGVTEDRAVAVGVTTFGGALANFGVNVLVIAFSLSSGLMVRKRQRHILRIVRDALMQVAARDALLREARLDLERAAGVGQAGRFSDQVLGSFRLGALLGRGGMGEIYEATHLDTAEEAAVKVLRRREGNTEGDLLSRFEREAAIAASLESPYLVRVLEVGSSSEHVLPFLAMERLHGADLAQVLRREVTLAWGDVLTMAQHIGEALGVAHAEQIVHRDIKPQNVFLTNDGVWKLLDFGVARFESSGTLTDGLIGTPAYLSPEQLRGQEPDGRADIHALAAVVYRALCGRPAFGGRDPATVLRQVGKSLPVRPSSIREDLPADLDDALRIAFAKDPAARYTQASELAQALELAFQSKLPADLKQRATRLNEEQSW